MGLLDKETNESPIKEAALRVHRQASSLRPLPCKDATGHVLPITPEEQARDARGIAAFVEWMLARPDEDPPGTWEEAMRDLDAQRPHRKLFEGGETPSIDDKAGRRADLVYPPVQKMTRV
jgi:hypothetical protein